MLARAFSTAESYPLYYIPDMGVSKMFLSAKIFYKKENPFEVFTLQMEKRMLLLVFNLLHKRLPLFFDLFQMFADGAVRFESETLGYLLLRVSVCS